MTAFWRPQAALLAALLTVLLVVPSFHSAQADDVSPTALNQTEALRASQGAVGRRVGQHVLLNRDGRPVQLDEFRGKPLLVSFIYTGCFQVCPATTRLLQQAVQDASETLGSTTFRVISIGFNQPADSPQALKSYALQYGIKESNWDFLSPAAATVDDLTRDFGFSYVATAAGFDHVMQVTVVDAEGRIYRQVYGDRFTADQLTEPLRQLINGAPLPDPNSLASLAELAERVRILCSVYDPLTGKYRVSYGLIIEIAGGLTFIAWILWLFLNEWLARRTLRRTVRQRLSQCTSRQ